MKSKFGEQDALLIIDAQKDFFPGGALGVEGGDEVIPVLNAWIEVARETPCAIYATRDWHPEDHSSFQREGGQWPVHCLRESDGAAFHPGLKLPKETRIISKGVDPQEEGYSAFEGTDLLKELQEKGILRLWVGGLAQDYCVKFTVLDALRAGFEVHLIKPATRPVNLKPGDGDEALQQMRAAGALVEESPRGEVESKYDVYRMADL